MKKPVQYLVVKKEIVSFMMILSSMNLACQNPSDKNSPTQPGAPSPTASPTPPFSGAGRPPLPLGPTPRPRPRPRPFAPPSIPSDPLLSSAHSDLTSRSAGLPSNLPSILDLSSSGSSSNTHLPVPLLSMGPTFDLSHSSTHSHHVPSMPLPPRLGPLRAPHLDLGAPELLALPHAQTSAEIVTNAIIAVQAHQATDRLGAIFEGRLGTIHDLLTNNQALLAHCQVALLEHILNLLQRPQFAEFSRVPESNERFFQIMADITQSLTQTEALTQQAIEQTQASRENELLAPFRARVIALIQNHIRDVLTLVYEQTELAPEERLREPEGEINTVELATQQVTVGGVSCSEAEWQDAFDVSQTPHPPQDTREGRWQTRSRMALHLWFNHLVEGHILRAPLEEILQELADAGEIPVDYWNQIYDGNPPEDEAALVYPSPENRRLLADLLAIPELSFASIQEAYEAQAAEMRAQIVELSQRYTPDAPVAIETIEDLTLTQLRARLVPIRLAQAREVAHQERVRQEEEIARQEATAAALTLRTAASHALGEGTTPESLTEVSDEALQERLVARYRALQGYDTATPNQQRRLNERIASMNTNQLIQGIEQCVRLTHLRTYTEAARVDHEVRERARIAHLRAQVAHALRVDESTLDGLNTDADLRGRLEVRLAEDRRITLLSRDRVNAFNLSIEERRQQGPTTTIYSMTIPELLRAVSAIPTRD